jgi:hypothetical protein
MQRLYDDIWNWLSENIIGCLIHDLKQLFDFFRLWQDPWAQERPVLLVGLGVGAILAGCQRDMFLLRLSSARWLPSHLN